MNPSSKLVYPSCAPAAPAQRVFKMKMQFPTSVICNAAGENVLQERIRMVLVMHSHLFINTYSQS